ncbi:MAG: hypothetical protein ABSA70_03790 [Terriglobia bacterium]
MRRPQRRDGFSSSTSSAIHYKQVATVNSQLELTVGSSQEAPTVRIRQLTD